MKPRELTKKEIKELQDQFPKLEEEKELQEQFPKIDKNISARIQNKLEMIVLLFWIAMLVGVMYYLYLTLTNQV